MFPDVTCFVRSNGFTHYIKTLATFFPFQIKRVFGLSVKEIVQYPDSKSLRTIRVVSTKTTDYSE